MVPFLRVARAVSLLALLVLGASAAIFVGPILDAGATGTYVDLSGSGEGPYVCDFMTDGSCNPTGETGTLSVSGPATFTLTAGDDSSGDDVELIVQNFGTMTGGTCDSNPTVVTPTVFGDGFSGGVESCTLDAGESAYLALEDEGPYTGRGDTGGAYTPTVGPDDPTALYSTGGGGGGGSSGTSDFSDLSGMVSWVDSSLSSLGPGVVAIGAGLVGLSAAVFGVWYLFRLFKRMAS